MGFEDAARRVQDLYLGGAVLEAAGAVPFEFLDATCLLGDATRIADRLVAYSRAGVTTLSVTPAGAASRPRLQALHLLADALDIAGVGH